MDASAALNPTPGRAMMSKSIELGLPGVGALLLAVLLAGCAGAPNHSRRLWPSPFPPPQQGPKPRLNRRLNQRPRSWGPLASCGNASRGCSWRWPLGLRQRKPVPNAGAWLLAAGVPLVFRWQAPVLTPLRRRKGRDWMRAGSSPQSEPGTVEPVDRGDGIFSRHWGKKMRIIILIVLVISGLTAVACSSAAPSTADTQAASRPTADVPATVEAGIRGTREAETEAEAAIDATVEAKVAATLTTSSTSAPRVTTASAPVATAAPMMAQTSPETDREALVAFYDATGGLNWEESNNWLSELPIGEWYGVTTDDNSRVIELALWNNQLSGEIPPELGNLANLESLQLRNNQLSGGIPPELGNLANLESLDLGENQLSGGIPPELGNLASLEYLELYENQLSGEIPPELGNLANLESLALRHNQLSGEIPPELGDLINLEWLALSGNLLSGEIPPELGDLINLEWLALSGNLLSGDIPPWLGSLASLEYLELYENQLSGEIPPELGNLENLTSLRLDVNQLTGCVPSSLSVQLDMDQSALGGLPFCR